MTYPDSNHDKLLRRIFFIFLVVVFFTVAPILILYSMGYRLDLKNKKIIETGVISISVTPREAEVYLNNIRITKSLPIRLTNRTPGTYNLRISLPGYKTWEKNIDIKSRQTTYIKNISLLKDSLPVPIFNNKNNIESFLPSSDGRFILLTSIKNNTRLIELFDSQSYELSPIFKLPYETNYKIEWSPFDNYILMIEANESTTSYTLLSADNTEFIKTYKVPLNDEQQIKYQWQKNSPIPTFFTNNGDKIFRFTTNSNDPIFDISSSTAWYIDNLEKLWVLEDNVIKNNNNDKQENRYTLPNAVSIEKIIEINNNRIILKTNNEVIILSRDNNELKSINTENFQRNPSTAEWLTWSSWELWSIYENNEPALLNRTSDSIKSVFPLDNVGALLLVNNHGIQSFNPGYYVNQDLYNGEVYSASVNIRENKIYFFGKVGERSSLYELEY